VRFAVREVKKIQLNFLVSKFGFEGMSLKKSEAGFQAHL
jgi:hypothetical protein